MSFSFCCSLRCKNIGIVQFSVTEHFKAAEPGRAHSPPGVFFFYDLSPIKVGSSIHYLES